MVNLKKDLIKNEQELREIIKNAEMRLKNAPAKSLQISFSKGKVMYYSKDTEMNTRRTYLKKTEEKLIRVLAQKQYDEKLIKIAKEQLHAIRELLDIYSPYAIQELYDKSHPERQRLIDSHIMSDIEFATKWQNEPFVSKGFSDFETEIMTERGERVRSKSEKIIADKLYSMNIPYRYEAPLEIRNLGIIHPDFTVLNVNERKVYYWEHLGKMDDLEYINKAIKRIDGYAKSSYIPGRNLILTLETKNIPLRTQTIEETIKQFLL